MNRKAQKSLCDALAASSELVNRVGDVSLEVYLLERDLQLIAERLVIAVGEAISQATRAEETLLEAILHAHDLSLALETESLMVTTRFGMKSFGMSRFATSLPSVAGC